MSVCYRVVSLVKNKRLIEVFSQTFEDCLILRPLAKDVGEVDRDDFEIFAFENQSLRKFVDKC